MKNYLYKEKNKIKSYPQIYEKIIVFMFCMRDNYLQKMH